MRNIGKLLGAAIGALALAGCARHYVREEPHHFSKDARGHRIACYATDVVDEFECVPVYREHHAWGYPGGYYAGPYGWAGVYGWPHYHSHYVYVEERPANPGPPPPPSHWRPRGKRK